MGSDVTRDLVVITNNLQNTQRMIYLLAALILLVLII